MEAVAESREEEGKEGREGYDKAAAATTEKGCRNDDGDDGLKVQGPSEESSGRSGSSSPNTSDSYEKVDHPPKESDGEGRGMRRYVETSASLRNLRCAHVDGIGNDQGIKAMYYKEWHYSKVLQILL